MSSIPYTINLSMELRVRLTDSFLRLDLVNQTHLVDLLPISRDRQVPPASSTSNPPLWEAGAVECPGLMALTTCPTLLLVLSGSPPDRSSHQWVPVAPVAPVLGTTTFPSRLDLVVLLLAQVKQLVRLPTTRLLETNPRLPSLPPSALAPTGSLLPLPSLPAYHLSPSL